MNLRSIFDHRPAQPARDRRERMMHAAPGLLVTVSTADPRSPATRRSEDVRDGFRTWNYDPDRLFTSYRGLWWQPLDGIVTLRGARRLAAHFWREDARSGEQAWPDMYTEHLLAALILAAATTREPSLRDVLHWLEQSSATTATGILRSAGHPDEAARLEILEHSTKQRRHAHRSGLTALRHLRDPMLAAWVCPPRHHAEGHDGGLRCSCADTMHIEQAKNTEVMIGTPSTLHLVARPTAGGGAALAAAMLDRALHDAVRQADRDRAPLHPPMTVVVNDGGRISGLVDLAGWMAHLAPRGIHLAVF